jgi:two-component system cell cycle response regulator DivK
MSKLLLVEDDEFSRDMLSRRLERQGFEMVVAADGREALQVARQHRPDLIVMDLDMPVMDGHSAIRALQNDPRTFKIPIIVLSAHSSPESVHEALSAGCRFFETKPIVLKRLLERIGEILGANEAS